MDSIMSIFPLQYFSLLKKWNFMNSILGLIEVLSLAFAFQCSWYISYSGEGGFFFSNPDLRTIFLCVFPFWLLILYLIRITRVQTNRYRVLFLLYLHFAFSVFVLLIIFNFILKRNLIPRLFFLEVSVLGFLFLFVVRLLEFKILRRKKSVRHFSHNVILIADDSSVAFIDNLLKNNKSGYRIVAIFTESAAVKSRYESISYILSERFLGILNDLIEVDLIDEVLYLKDAKDSEEIRVIIKSCEDLGVTFRLRDDNNKNILSSAVKTNVSSGTFLTFINMPFNSFSMAIRKILDVNIALLLIAALFPVYIIIGILIKLNSKGPVICKQLIAGLGGRQIYLYKFRTTVGKKCPEIPLSAATTTDSENKPDETEKIKLTRIGKFLITSGLEQIPLLFNVARGEISIINTRTLPQIEFTQHSDSND